jgi:hypothetical protein
MNDDQLMTAVRESFAEVRLDVPVEQTARRGRVLRGRSRACRVAGVAGVAAIAGLTAVAATGLGRATVPVPVRFPASPRPIVIASASASASAGTGAGAGRTTLDAWTVTRGPGGAIGVTIRQLLDVTGLQSALRADGIPIRIAFQAGLPSDSPPLPAGCANVRMSDEANGKLQSKILGLPVDPVSGLAPGPADGPGIAITIHRQLIPRGIGLYLAVQSGSNGQHYGWGLDLVQATPACTG